jgi:hypothetical protein
MNSLKRGWLVAAGAAALSAMVTGCGPSLPDKVAFAGQSATLQSGTQVNFQDAWCRAKKCDVRLWIANMTQAFMLVDRDGFALRLPDGRVVRRVGAIHDVYNIPPGGGHQVNLGFEDRELDLRTAQGVSLVVGGVAFSTDPRPRVVGEIPLVATGEHR